MWDFEKNVETQAHKLMRGGTLKRRAHNEFYAEGDDYEDMLSLLNVVPPYHNEWEQVSIERNAIHPPMAIPQKKYLKEKICTDCGGQPLTCDYCKVDVWRKGWSRNIKKKKHRDNVNARN